MRMNLPATSQCPSGDDPDRHEIEIREYDPHGQLDNPVPGYVEHRAEQARFVPLAGDVSVQRIRNEQQN
jgi:hypothetical protein